MAKKDKSLLGSILKGAFDLTGEVIKTTYDAATSKEAKKFYACGKKIEVFTPFGKEI